MALVLSGERPAAAAASFNPVRWMVAVFAKLHVERTQRVALKTLLELDQYRLDDLGINRRDLFDALEAPRPTRLLTQRRDRRIGR